MPLEGRTLLLRGLSAGKGTVRGKGIDAKSRNARSRKLLKIEGSNRKESSSGYSQKKRGEDWLKQRGRGSSSVVRRGDWVKNKRDYLLGGEKGAWTPGRRGIA